MLAREFARLIRQFARDERGVIVIEFVIYLPLLLWSYITLFAYWDAFREVNVAQKATYSVADLLSREQSAVSDSYRDGLRTVFSYMVNVDPSAVVMRITSIRRVETSDGGSQNEVHWSYSPGNSKPELKTSDLVYFTDRIPMMAVGDYVIMMETSYAYEPPIQYVFFGAWVAPDDVSNLIVTRPRFQRICEVGQTCT